MKRSEEVRATSATGGQKGKKEERYSLLPIEALDEVSRLYARGAEKYEAENWRKGYDWSLSYDALMRHATAFWSGEDLDSETNLSHMAAVIFHASAMLVYCKDPERYAQFDDRPKEFSCNPTNPSLRNKTKPNPSLKSKSLLRALKRWLRS